MFTGFSEFNLLWFLFCSHSENTENFYSFENIGFPLCWITVFCLLLLVTKRFWLQRVRTDISKSTEPLFFEAALLRVHWMWAELRQEARVQKLLKDFPLVFVHRREPAVKQTQTLFVKKPHFWLEGLKWRTRASSALNMCCYSFLFW